MKRIAIVGVGPTGIYTFYELVKRGEPLAITLFEKEAQAGVGMPYSDDNTAAQMLANIASIEIPPIDLTYLQWLQQQSDDWLAARGLERHALHERQFLPRVILGEYYRDRFLYLVERARDVGFVISVCESCEVTDIAVQPTGIAIHTDSAADPVIVDLVAIATGHLWPEEERASRQYFPSPWTGLMEARIAPCRVGILGTSLSAIDAAVAVVARHGVFHTEDDKTTHFSLHPGSEALEITLMSRHGVLPEADFYCPIPWEPLEIATPAALEAAIAEGSDALLDRMDGFGFARRFSRELIGVTDGVVFDLTRLFDYTVTFLLCVLLHRIGLGFRLLGDGVRLLVRLGLDGAGLILQAIGLGVSLAFQRIDLLIRILFNCLRFIRRGILHLLRIIFSLIQFVINFRRIVAAKQGQAQGGSE